MKTTLLGLSLLTLATLAQAAEPAPQFRWDANQPFATFKGSSAEQAALVDLVLQKTDAVDAMVLFVASDTAYSLGRIEDAGFLYFAAEVRSAYDLRRFAPKGSGHDVAEYLGFLKFNAAQVINPALTAVPAHFIAVSDRLSAWDCAEVAGYRPGWDVVHEETASPSCQEVLKQRAGPTAGIATLLRNPQYASALETVRRYNLAKPQERTPELKQQSDRAYAQMQQIETEMHIKGFAGFSR